MKLTRQTKYSGVALGLITAFSTVVSAETLSSPAGNMPAAKGGAVQGAASSGAQAGGFNPAVSLILSGRYVRYSNPSEEPGVSGFMQPSHGHGHGEEQGHHHGTLGEEGFSLADTELSVSGNIDPYFFGSLNLAFTSEDDVEVEEAYVQTTILGHGFTAKGGRFLSGIGYVSEQHAHAWDFVDQPLVYQTFFGAHLRQDGVQLRWIAPTDQFIELGMEAANRRNNGSGPAVFANVGGDVGTDHAWRIGVSHLRSEASDREFHSEVEVSGEEEEVHNLFTGDSRISGINAVWKWAPNGNATRTNFKLQGEYFQRRESGTVTFDEEEVAGGPVEGNYRAVQNGWYLQGVYQFMPRWRVGLRHDRLQTSSADWGANNANLEEFSGSFKPSRNTLMVDYSPSEFSRVRLQAARDRSQEGRTDNQFALQYIMSLGSHGAHKF
jgi:hypothetical protein